MLVSLLLAFFSVLVAIPFLITDGKPGELLQLAGQVAWAFVTVGFPPHPG